MGPSRLLAILFVGALFLLACGSDDPEPVPAAADGMRVASFDFAESELLAEMYAQLLEEAGVPVVRLGSVGPREVVAPAMELGHIDLVPEYVGTALQYTGASEASSDTHAALFDLRQRLDRRGLTALAPARAEDKNVVVVTVDTAEREGLERISDLGPVASGFRFGGPAECRDRDLCLLGLNRVYGLSFAEFVPQRSLDFTAEALRRDEIDVGLMFSTAAPLESTDLVALEDDRGLQPAENIVPVVRLDAVRQWGEPASDALNSLAPLLSTPELRRLNMLATEGGSIADVVRDWLTAHELIGN